METFESLGMRKRAQTLYFPAVGFFDAMPLEGGRLQHAAAGGIGGQVVRLLVAQNPPKPGVERLAVLGFEQDARIIRGGAGSGRDGKGQRADRRGKHGCEICFQERLLLDRYL